MNIYKAVANIEASDCSVYILQGSKASIQITSDNQNKVISLDVIKEGETPQLTPLTYVSTGNQFTLLPNLSLEQIALNEIQSFLKWEDNLNFSIIKNKLMFDDISLLFQIQLDATSKLFPAARFKHVVEILVNHAMKQQNDNSITTLLIENQLVICAIKNGKLQLSNIFQVANNEEIIYYIMLMVQELNFDVETLNLQIYGEYEEKAYLKDNLSNFVRNVTSNVNSNIPDMRYSGVAKFIETI
jgi:hypothetical protein